MKKQENKIFLKVIDEGNGISDDEKKKVFEKFYRSGDEAIRKTKGTGLGLYLCKRIAESHKAKIKITITINLQEVFLLLNLKHNEGRKSKYFIGGR